MQTTLWTKISDFPLDSPDAPIPFSKKLATQNGWDLAFTHSAIEEYKRFIYLCAVENQPMTPSKTIDTVWHLHLTYTRNYWDDFCGNVLRRPLHHNPSEGSTIDENKHKSAYQRTLVSYTKHFNQAAPKEIWGLTKRKTTEQRHISQVSIVAGLLILAYLSTPLINTANIANLQLASFGVLLVIIIVLIVLSIIFGKTGGNGGCSSGCGSSCGGD